MGESVVELHILHNIKLPILLTAVLVGSALAMGSAALQVTLNNPLADPGIIGISSGASLMAAIFLVLFSALGTMPQAFLYQYSVFLLPLFCFIGACLSGALIYVVAKKIGHSVASFILAGIAISTVFSAVVGWIYLSAPPQALSYTNYYSLLVAGALIVLALVSLMAMPKQLNLLYLGESAAKSAGVNTKTQQRKIFIIVAILVGVSVSIAGSVAFLGLLVPHAIRRLHGYDNKQVLVYSALLGSSVLLCCAIINEYLFSTAVPLSMLTASIGAPLFIYVLFANKLG
jgi:iron complex transport system permease protein